MATIRPTRNNFAPHAFARQPVTRQNPGVRFLDDDRRSALTAKPKLQLLKAQQIDDISNTVEGIIDTKKNNFTPGRESNCASFLAIAGVVAIAVLAILSLVAAFTGIGTGLMIGVGVGSALLGLTLIVGANIVKNKAQEKVADEENVDEIHRAAIRHSITEIIDEDDQNRLTVDQRRVHLPEGAPASTEMRDHNEAIYV